MRAASGKKYLLDELVICCVTVRPTDIRDLRGVLERERGAGVELAGFISLREPTRAIAYDTSRSKTSLRSGSTINLDIHQVRFRY